MSSGIETLLNRIRENRSLMLSGEEAVRQRAILPILGHLGWDRDDINQVVPEFGIGTGRVDYCLRVGEQKKVFIEVKRASENLDRHQKQLLDYSFQEGVELAVLTNGLVWWLYLPLFPGSWEQRKFLAIDFQQQDINHVAKNLEKYLSFESTANGKSISSARQIHESKSKERLIRETIPKAWTELCEEPDELLLEIFADKVESLCGHKPELENLAEYLANNYNFILQADSAHPKDRPIKVPEKPTSRRPSSELRRGKYTFTRPIAYTFQGRRNPVRNFIEILLRLCESLADDHGSEFERILILRGRNRPYFTRNAEELRVPQEIKKSGIYAETNLSATNVIDRCHLVLTNFGYSPDVFHVEVEPRNQ